jgi:hypothetical protein
MDSHDIHVVTLPMGYTNSMQEFQHSMSHIIEHLSPDWALAFVDDIGVKGPNTQYNNETIPGNPGIRRFIWEYAHTLYECLAVMVTARATASGKKLVLATPCITVMGYECNLNGIRPHHRIATKVQNWPTRKHHTCQRIPGHSWSCQELDQEFCSNSQTAYRINKAQTG